MNDLLGMYRKTLELEGNMKGTPDTCSINRALELCADAYQLGKQEHDWEALRNQAAIAAMQAMIATSDASLLKHKEEVAWDAVSFADALIKQLKGRDT